MRALERAAFASGTSETELQLRAGTAVAEEVFRITAGSGRVVVLVGHGNNGRDGAVAARWLLEHGLAVGLVLAPRHAVTPDELAHLRRLGAECLPGTDRVAVEHVLGGAALALDALA